MAPLHRFRFPVALLLAGVFLLGLQPGHTQEKKKSPDKPCDGDVWCGLFLAKGGDSVEKPDPKNAELIKQLRKAFPTLGDFQLVGENSGSVYKEYECWIVPSKQLFLKVDSLGPHESASGIHLHLQLWQEEHVILKTDAILRRQPVFIAGPQWGDGRLIMVLKLAGERE